jgi:hypothetical protein
MISPLGQTRVIGTSLLEGASLRAVEMELTDLTPFCYHWQTEQSRRMVLLK